jgi:hypothetical protein
MPGSVTSEPADQGCCGRRFQSRYRRDAGPVIAGLDVEPNQRLLLEKLLLDKTNTTYSEAQWNKLIAFYFNAVTIIGGILVSFGIVLQQQADVQAMGYDTAVFWTLIIVSGIVNVVTALKEAGNYSELARIYDETFTAIESRSWDFFVTVNGTEEKAERDRQVSEFVKEVNELMREQASSLRAARAKGQRVADSIRARVSEFSNRPEVRELHDRFAVATINHSPPRSEAAAAGDEATTIPVASVSDSVPNDTSP